MSRGPDAATLLERALIADAARAGAAIAVIEGESRRWASATFVGARHVLTLVAADSRQLAAWLGGLAEAELPIRGHLVADIAVVSRTRAGGDVTAVVEALTVEER